jgi:hypothetical protein
MKMYRNTGTYTTPVWSLVSEVGDVNIPDLNRGMAELKRRASDFTKNLATLIQSIAIEFTMPSGLGITTWSAMKTNFFAGTAEEWAIMDGDISAGMGAEGLRCPVLIENFPWNQPLEEVAGFDIRLVCAYWESPQGTERDPVWYSVSSTTTTTT